MRATEVETVSEVPIDQIVAGDNDRKNFDQGELAELAASIVELGLVQPITVRPLGGRFEIVCGERRFRACQLAGLSTIRAFVRDLDDRAASAMMLVENMARADLDPVDEARAFQARIDQFGLTPREVGQWAGVTTDKVNLRLKLLALIPAAQEMTSKGALPIGFAPMLAPLDANRQQLALAAWRQSSGSLNWWAWDSLCKRLAMEQAQDSMFDVDSFLQVEEFVLTAKATRTPTAKLRSLVAMMADALEVAGAAPELVAQARSATAAVAA